MSFINIMNRADPRTEPCGAPLVTGAQSHADSVTDDYSLFSII